MSVLKLKRISATDSRVLIQSSDEVYIGNVSTPNNPPEISSRYDYIPIVGGSPTVVKARNLRPTSEFTHQSSVITTGTSRLKEYLPWETKISAISQIDSTIVGITGLTGSKVIPANRYVQSTNQTNFPYARRYANTTFTESLGDTNIARFYPVVASYYKLSADEQKDYYGLPENEQRSRYRLFDNFARRIVRDQIVSPEYVCTNLEFNYLTEMQGDDPMLSASYSSATNFATAFTCKNFYNGDWSTDITIELDSLSGEEDQYISYAKTNNIREYVNFGQNDGTVWAAYTNDLIYDATDDAPLYELFPGEGGYYELADGTLYDMEGNRVYVGKRGGYNLQSKAVGEYLRASAFPVNVSEIESAEYLKYEYVERIKGSNRLENLPKHKSNMYSIEIRNSGIDSDNGISSEVRSKIKLSINNIIRALAARVAPAHTQLLKVVWSGT